ncbi:MAG: hypothetical protein QF819_08890 [Gemmatimonadota bacterium]|nr:hypothetical protein [Gemmatimonadota bacterium]MDP6803274.1 hypothetical protein [Gemmatimonadota bacterium]MDP7032211.1 hypothetical protein [Gemmatimonadota bacterium]
MTAGGQRLRAGVTRLGAGQAMRALAASLAWGVVRVLALAALVLSADALWPLPAVVRAALLAGMAVVGAWPVMRWIGRWGSALRSAEAAARRTEEEADTLRGRLVIALQVLRVRDDARTGYSTDLVDACVNEAADRLDAVDSARFPGRRDLRRASVAGAVALAACAAGVFALGPVSSADRAKRLLFAWGDLAPKPPPVFAVAPGDVAVPRGDAVSLVAVVDHPRTRAGALVGVLQTRAAEDPTALWTERPLRGDSLGARARFTAEFPSVAESFEYRFVHAREKSGTFRVTAQSRPVLALDEVLFRFPEYTGLPDRTRRDGSGDLTAIRGTRATLRVRCTNPVADARLVLGEGGEIVLEPGAEGELIAEVLLASRDTYQLLVTDRLGLTNPNPLEYRIRPLPDEAPFIRLLEPGERVDLDDSMRALLRFSAVDDFGLGPVVLVWETSRTPGEPSEAEIHPARAGSSEIAGSHEWSLANLDLLPGDVVSYHLCVSDNNTLDGPSVARTRTHTLRFPTMAEVFAQFDRAEEDAIGELEEVAGRIEEVEERVEEITREMLKKGDTSWENRAGMERALGAQEELSRELERIRDDIGENLRNLAESEFMTLEAMEKMAALRDLLDEVLDRDLKDALEKLRKLAEERSPERRDPDAGEDFAGAQEQLLKNLDRVIENLKQFRLEERMKAAVREMEELAARQERIHDELETARKPGEKAEGDERGDDAQSDLQEDGAEEDGPGDSGEPREDPEETTTPDEGRLAEEQEGLAQEAERMEDELRELAEQVAEMRDARDAAGMQELADKMEAGEIPEAMQESADRMESGKSESAREKSEEALTKLRDMHEALSSMQTDMAGRAIQISQAGINRAVRDLLTLSSDEESLADALAGIPHNSASATRAFTDEQHLLLRGAERVEDKLEEVAKGTPLMDSSVGQSLREGLELMETATDALEGGSVRVSQLRGEAAVEKLNRVVIQLLEASEQMSSCSSGMGMGEALRRLQQMGEDQEALGQMLRELMEQNGQGMDHRLNAHLDSLAKEQARIREELRQFLDESGDSEATLGRLDDVEEKLAEIEARLRAGELGDELLRDQEWAATRLLDSQRSLRERDFGRARRSETGGDGEAPPPAPLPGGIEERERDLREDLLKALDSRVPPRYEELIRRYFRSLAEDEAARRTTPPEGQVGDSP